MGLVGSSAIMPLMLVGSRPARPADRGLAAQLTQEGGKMRTPMAAAGSAVFFVLAPGVVAGLVPWWLTDWRVEQPLPYWAPLRVVGVAVLAAGAAVLVHAFIRFVVEGSGSATRA
jgi:hypothetical protein